MSKAASVKQKKKKLDKLDDIKTKHFALNDTLLQV
jgi:hypothetical protein